MATFTPAPQARFAPLDWALGVTVVVVWGLNFLVGKFTLQYLTASQLGLLRFTFAAFPLVFFVPVPRLPVRVVLAYGLVQGFAQFACLSGAMKAGLSSAMASILMQVQVLFTPLMAWTFLAEGITFRTLLAGVIGILALILLLLPQAPDASQAPLVGVLLALGAALSWSISNVLLRSAARRAPELSVTSLMAWSALVAVPAFAVMSLLMDGEPLLSNAATRRPDVLMACACLGWVSTTAAYVMWGRLLQRHSASRVAPLGLGVPLVGVLGGVTVWGEQLSAIQGIAAVLLLAALLVSTWSKPN
jgi:O-acetylserine/cysteine efflux transporter